MSGSSSLSSAAGTGPTKTKKRRIREGIGPNVHEERYKHATLGGGSGVAWIHPSLQPLVDILDNDLWAILRSRGMFTKNLKK